MLFENKKQTILHLLIKYFQIIYFYMKIFYYRDDQRWGITLEKSLTGETLCISITLQKYYL